MFKLISEKAPEDGINESYRIHVQCTCVLNDLKQKCVIIQVYRPLFFHLEYEHENTCSIKYLHAHTRTHKSKLQND